MSVAIQTQEVLLDGELVSQEGVVSFRDGGIVDIMSFVDDDVYYARIGRDDIADVFSAPANVMSLEDRLTNDFGGKSRSRTRRKRHRKSRRRRSLK